MAESKPAAKAIPSAHVDELLIRLRWILGLLVLIIAWIEGGTKALTSQFLIWLAVIIVINLIYGTLLRFLPKFAKWLPIPTLLVDTILFGILPYLVESSINLLEFSAIFPALIAAVRFGPFAGLGIAALMTLSLLVNAGLPRETPNARDLVSRSLPIAALFAGVVIVGFLSKHEKEDAIHEATQQLDELRGVMAGAKLLYQTSDLFTLTTSYRPVMEAMLEAGVKGLPEARHEDGLPIGLALFFDDHDPDKCLRVVASRNLDQTDDARHIPGNAGIVAEALQSGRAAVTERVNLDPELGGFAAMAHCRSAVCYPLQSGLEQYGVVVLASAAPRRPSQQHLDLMRAFTSQASIAFQNARLYQITRKEQDRIIRSDTEVRQKLARDLHDGPTQKVSGLVMQLEYITRLLDTNLPEAKRELEKARATAQQTVKEIRTTLFTLRPLALESKGLSAALEQYGERLRETEKVPITIELGNFGTELETNTATTIFAIIEEAVGNARKHADKSPIHVRLAHEEHSLIATVQDQGPGFDYDRVSRTYDKHASLGLQNMRERALLINAELRIDSTPGQGTRVTLVVPLANLNPFEKI